MYEVTSIERLFGDGEEFDNLADAERAALKNSDADSAWMVYDTAGGEGDNNVLVIAFCGHLYRCIDGVSNENI